MPADKKLRSNVGIFFLIAAMFIVLGFLVSRGFLAIGFIFLIIGLASIGRPRVSFFDEGEGGEEGERGDQVD